MNVIQLLYRCFYKVLPITQNCLNHWIERAKQIPDEELRKQALTSLSKKRFHSDGGAVFGAFSRIPNPHLVNAIATFQTISDYLDNLCDRSTSLDADDFIRLHQSMIDAVSPVAVPREPGYYYDCHPEKEDGGYLEELVRVTHQSLMALPHYHEIAEHVVCLTRLYCDLQVHKHVELAERVPRLQDWFEHVKQDHRISQQLGVNLSDLNLKWWEFAAASGSTLGMFALWTEAAVSRKKMHDRTLVGKQYFPWITGLHILLDYWIDQEEDRLAGDLNFFSYYESLEEAYQRLTLFTGWARKQARKCKESRFHQLVVEGLLGMYLSDQKAAQQPGYNQVCRLVAESGWITKLFFGASQYYRRRVKHA